MASLSGGHLVARALKNEGIDAIFTLCGGHIDPIYDGCLAEGIRIVDTRHEQAAAHAADAYARLTRGVGVAVVTAGPGVTDAVTGVANAAYAHSPLVLIGGAAPLELAHKGALQEMEQVALFRPITKWSSSIHDTRRIPDLLAMAFRVALSGRPGPVFVEIPFDILFNRVEDYTVRLPEKYRTRARAHGDPDYVAQAARLLAEARQPVVLAGTAVYWDEAQEELRALAERLHLPVYANGMGRGTLPFDHSTSLQLSRSQALADAAVVLTLGTALDFRRNYGQSFPDAKLIQVDKDGAELGRNRAVDVGIVGDTRAVLGQLLQEFERRRPAPDYSEWLGKLRQAEESRKRKQAQLENLDSVPINHFRMAKEIDAFVDDDTIIIGDGGDIVATCAKVITVRKPGKWLDPGPLGCLGIGAPFALAARLLHPEAKVLVINGDGAFGLNGFEMDTALRHNLPIVSIVGNDQGWGQIRGPQKQLYGRELATGLAKTRYDRVVEALGGYGELVERPEEIRPALERAFASGRPACVNVILDPEGLASLQAGKVYVL